MSEQGNHKDSVSSREARAASVTEHLRAAKAELLSATPEPLPAQSVSLKPLFIGVGVIALGALIWMFAGGGGAPVESPDAALAVEQVDAQQERASLALEAAREARERVRAAEEAAREARERRAALEAEQAAQREREVEQARREAEEQAAALAAARESAEREALQARQAQARREAAERAAAAERERQAALAAQRQQERQAAEAAEAARLAEERRAAEQERQAALQAEVETSAAAEEIEMPTADTGSSVAPATVATPESRDRVEAFRQARPGEVRSGSVEAATDAEFSADPCKGPSARFLSTCR